MSVCGQTEEDSCAEEPAATDSAAGGTRAMREDKAASKVVRVLTVLAYLLSVSLAAILLSVYYVCVWRSPDLPPLSDAGEGQLEARRGDLADYAHGNSPAGYNDTLTAGGGNTTVSDVQESQDNSTISPPMTNMTEVDPLYASTNLTQDPAGTTDADSLPTEQNVT